MRQTKTELFIEIEETIYVMHRGSHGAAICNADSHEGSVTIDICPLCHQAVLEPEKIELKEIKEK